MQGIHRVLIVAASVSVAGCASIVSKSQYPVTINSNPPGATVLIKNKSGAEMHKAQTPTTLTLNASAGFFSPAQYSLEFQKDGYEKSTSTTQAGIDGWYIANILFGGLIGLLIIDPATGAMWKLEENVTTSLVASSGTAPAQAPIAPTSQPTNQGAESEVDAITDQLRNLKKLKEDGVLTDDEYERKRKVLVEKL